MHIKYEDGSEQVVGTDSTWLALNADPLFNPIVSSSYPLNNQGPQENIDARRSPSGDGCMTCWRLAGFVPTAAWERAKERDAYSPALSAKIAQPVRVTTGFKPASIIQVGPGHWFFDFGTELMGGIELEWTGGTASLNIRASEELVSNTSIKFPMRTGNQFEMNWEGGPGTSSFEQHEYWLFRYGELRVKTSLSQSTSACDCIPHLQDEGQVASFRCPDGQTIDKVTFASYGTPTGQCQDKNGANTIAMNSTCHANSSRSVVESLCLGKGSCSFEASSAVFGHDPCHKTPKGFAGVVECSGAAGMAVAGDPPFKLTAWVVNYPWVDSDSAFNSSDDMLNKVWKLCRNTLKVTSLDTTTDSNTRERLPYEADGYITGSSRYVFQREFAWQRHSTQHNLMNPTWPTEWRQTIPLLAHDDFMKTGEVVIAQDHWEFLKSSSQAQCINTSSGLLDFSHCSRPSGVRDIVDWPQVKRDGYQMTEVNTVINAFAVGALRALAVLANATGKLDEAVTLQHRASALSDAMADKLFDNSTGLFVDGQGSGADHHSAWHAQVFPLFFGAGLAEQNERLLAFLKSKRMAGSVYGAFAFLLGLYRRFSDDHGALALDLLTTCDGNSWCGMLSAGATAVMEAWTREEIGEAQPVLVAPVGVSPRHRHRAGAHGRPGLGARLQSEVRPQPGALAWAELKLPVLSGFIEVRVEQSASEFELTLVAPGNTQATACLPRLGGASAELVVDGRPRSGHASGDFLCVAGVGSGRHTIIRRARGGEVFV
ncbi:unnamed protein product [Prorocentrum cordatum]|uniref:alpha-L-rhamnosidase n=1 Tax=Prorocentrum cordatum TaxID=2364126 RepID=A0ABN9QYF5_9DINO|nr:unnamed protein product [Polarella glacialis]